MLETAWLKVGRKGGAARERERVREIAIMGNGEGIVLSLVKTMRVEWHLVRSDAFGLACGQNGFYQRATCVCVCVYKV